MRPPDTVERRTTDAERKVFQKATTRSHKHLGTFVENFMMECLGAGIEPRTAAAAMTLYVTSSLAKVAAISSGMPEGTISDAEIRTIGSDTQAFIASQVNDLISDHNRRREESN